MQAPFTKKLYNILEDEQYLGIIGWLKDKTIIEIRNEERFQKEILPKYFRHGKMASFIRQLNLYGFKKIRSAAMQSYTHSYLENGKSLKDIVCVKKNQQENQARTRTERGPSLSIIQQPEQPIQNRARGQIVSQVNWQQNFYRIQNQIQQSMRFTFVPQQMNPWGVPQNTIQYPTNCCLPGGFYFA